MNTARQDRISISILVSANNTILLNFHKWIVSHDDLIWFACLGMIWFWYQNILLVYTLLLILMTYSYSRRNKTKTKTKTETGSLNWAPTIQNNSDYSLMFQVETTFASRHKYGVWSIRLFCSHLIWFTLTRSEFNQYTD